MRIFLAGVSCVGKTAIGARLAGLLQFGFFDLDIETERFFGMSTTVVLRDTPENILGRITFYDVESCPMQRDLTDHEKRHHLREIKRDIAYFNRSFCRADLSVDISGSSLDDASRRVWGALNLARRQEEAMRGTLHCNDASTSLFPTGTNNGAQER